MSLKIDPSRFMPFDVSFVTPEREINSDLELLRKVDLFFLKHPDDPRTIKGRVQILSQEAAPEINELADAYLDCLTKMSLPELQDQLRECATGFEQRLLIGGDAASIGASSVQYPEGSMTAVVEEYEKEMLDSLRAHFKEAYTS